MILLCLINLILEEIRLSRKRKQQEEVAESSDSENDSVVAVSPTVNITFKAGTYKLKKWYKGKPTVYNTFG